jgi:phosphoribosyl 1,2-cyclic phosphodiesterase
MKKRKDRHNDHGALHDDEIVFLGTGGARYVIATQLRATGGMLFRTGGKNIIVDPGPGSLLRLLTYVPDVRPEKVDALILSHKHIDHSADINVYLDVITRGGFQKKGVLIAPQDAFGEDGVIYRYLLEHLEQVVKIEPGKEIAIGSCSIRFPLRHDHRVETYGFTLSCGDYTIGYIADTKYFPQIEHSYMTDVLILNLIALKPSGIDHLSIPDCERIIAAVKPAVAIITHFGMTVVKAGPWNIARQLQKSTGITVLAAEDGKHYPLNKLLSYREHTK